MANHPLTDWRLSEGLTLHAAALRLGLKSKGFLSDLENGRASASVAVALQIEARTDGRVPAPSVCPAVAQVRAGGRA